MSRLEAQLTPEEVEVKTAQIFQAGSARFETKHRRKDGQVVDLEVSANVIRDGDDSIIVAFVRDVTERNLAARQLAHLARTDYLTGIGNRRSFEEAMEGMRERQVLCHGRGFAIVMCDVDDFKAYNDTYGHLKGDDVLADMATAMSSSLRAGDLLFRYGGEEFVVYLPGADREAALIVADRIRTSVRALAIAHDGSRHGFVTVSCGISVCDGNAGRCPGTGNCRGWEDALGRADEGLYRAKAAGKDRTEVTV
jgi:diguanylate cyclase (GGDEF)-like protein